MLGLDIRKREDGLAKTSVTRVDGPIEEDDFRIDVKF